VQRTWIFVETLKLAGTEGAISSWMAIGLNITILRCSAPSVAGLPALLVITIIWKLLMVTKPYFLYQTFLTLVTGHHPRHPNLLPA
jgi:hypothetical protein